MRLKDARHISWRNAIWISSQGYKKEGKFRVRVIFLIIQMSHYKRDVSPINCISHCKMPAIFLHGTKDEIVPICHSRKLFSVYSYSL